MAQQPSSDKGEYPSHSLSAMAASHPDAALGKTSVVYDAMLKDIRTWAMVLAGFGVLNLFTSGLANAAWGILLIVVGGASFLFKNAAMYVVYGVIMLWAAISNATSGSTGWIVFSVIQVILAINVFRSFVRYRRAESDLATATGMGVYVTPPQQRAERFFPALGLVLGVLSFSALLLSFGAIIVAIAAQEATAQPPEAIVLVFGLALDVAVLALAINLAALLSRFRNRMLSVLGLIASAISIIIYLVLFFIP